MIALGAALAARGHDVVLETWTRWADHVRALGMTFAPAPEYPPFPTRERPLKPYEAVYRAALDTRPLIAEVRKRFELSVAEVDHLELHRRASIGVAAVSPDRAHLVDVLDTVEQLVAYRPEVELLSVRRTLRSADD